ncbi:MAG TPA: alkaline phosphatase family protein [Kofleriaceae bacterium]|jgi:phospholipase C
MINRRDAIKRIGGLAGAAAMAKYLPACHSDNGPVGITTWVYMMLENRSYDHYLGARALMGKGGDGLQATFSNPDLNGNPVAPFEPNVNQLCVVDPPHGWDELHASWDNGANDGFVKQFQTADSTTDTSVMQYLTSTELPITWALADAYTSCDRWFCALLGPTLPNRAYWHAATSFGIGPDGVNSDGTPALDMNGDPVGANTLILDAFSNGVPVPTIYNRLHDSNVDWAYYYGSLAVLSLLGNPGPYQLDLGPNDGTGNIRRFGDYQGQDGQFFKDCAAGTLPPVVYIDPYFYLDDDHPPIHPINGQQLIAAVYTALAKSPQWKNCCLVVTYDENGGFFDHVNPPSTSDDTATMFPMATPGFEQCGFRVPAIVVGPYVKQNYVSSVVYDHTSALKHLQDTFGLENLNSRTAAANNLLDCIDMERLAKGDWAQPITLPTIDLSEFPQDPSMCTTTESLIAMGAGQDPISEYADAHPGVFKPGVTDLRDGAEEHMRGIRQFLRDHMNKYE